MPAAVAICVVSLAGVIWFGVLNAGLIVSLSNDAPLAVVPADFAAANAIGVAAFAAIVFVLYRWMYARAGNMPPS